MHQTSKTNWKTQGGDHTLALNSCYIEVYKYSQHHPAQKFIKLILVNFVLIEREKKYKKFQMRGIFLLVMDANNFNGQIFCWYNFVLYYHFCFLWFADVFLKHYNSLTTKIHAFCFGEALKLKKNDQLPLIFLVA